MSQLAIFFFFFLRKKTLAQQKTARVSRLLQPLVICFAGTFMETLGQGGAGTCKSIDFLWHKPTAPCQNNEFLSTPHHLGRMWFYMQSEPEVCADSGGGRAPFTFHPVVLGLFVFFPRPLCYSSTREETRGAAKWWVRAWCNQESTIRLQVISVFPTFSVACFWLSETGNIMQLQINKWKSL